MIFVDRSAKGTNLTENEKDLDPVNCRQNSFSGCRVEIENVPVYQSPGCSSFLTGCPKTHLVENSEDLFPVKCRHNPFHG